MATAFEIVKSAWMMVNGSGQFMGLFFAAIIFLFLISEGKAAQNDEESRESIAIDRALFIYGVASLLIVFLPFAVTIFDKDYWQMFLVLPIIPICAYAGTKAFYMQDKKSDKALVLVSLLLITFIAGIMFNSSTEYEKRENGAYIKSEYLEMFAAMNVDGAPVILVAPDEIMESARAYTTVINMPYEIPYMTENADVAEQVYGGRLRALHNNMQDPVGRIGGIVETFRDYQCNYLVLPKEADDRFIMENSGFSVVYEDELYVAYYDGTQ